MAQVVDDSVEAYFARFRDLDRPPGPLPAPRFGLKRRLKSRIRDALPRAVYEHAVGTGGYGVRLATGRARGRGRLLPDFLIIGAAKCGTSSLYQWLGQHPDVRPATTKEVHFFDYNHFRRVDWYRAHFPRGRERSSDAPFLTGEASVSYLSHRWAPERVARLLPHVKLIAVFRDPVDRAYSQFQMSRREGYEPFETFEEAVAWESVRLAPELERVEREHRYNSLPLGTWSYLQRSRYAEHLERWLALFPREQFLFLRAEDMFADPYAALERTDAFLGLPAHRPSELPRVLDGGDYAPLAAETRAQLDEYFRPHNERLAELTGIDFAWA